VARSLRTAGPALGAAFAAALCLAQPAPAQHPLPPRDRTLAERLALSDAVALARVGLVEPGRLHLEDARALRGELPAEFEVKRSPLAPPPFEEGDLAVFFLRGARSPYVLADAPREMIRPADDAAARALAQAVVDLAAAGADRARVLALHATWLEGTDDGLRELAVAALDDPRETVPASFASERARVALDAARPAGVRRACAVVAARDPEALGLLLSWVPGGSSEADVGVGDVALRRGAMARAAEVESATLRALGSASPALRRAGLRAAAGLGDRAGPALRAEVAALAGRETDVEVRAEAERAARRIGLR
jgi:hypothetical protein